MAKCVVLLSGGLDSATCAAMARSLGFEVCALTVRYGQRHAVELEAARRVGAALGASEHRFVEVELGAIGGSALTDPAIPVPKGRGASGPGIPATYVPARNTVLLALALAYAEVLGASDIFIGVNAVDYSGYPDCRPEFVQAFEHLAALATRAADGGVAPTIHAPLISITKAQIIERGLALGVDYSITSSCYDPRPDGRACGECDACSIRAKAFAELGMRDPAA